MGMTSQNQEFCLEEFKSSEEIFHPPQNVRNGVQVLVIANIGPTILNQRIVTPRGVILEGGRLMGSSQVRPLVRQKVCSLRTMYTCKYMHKLIFFTINCTLISSLDFWSKEVIEISI